MEEQDVLAGVSVFVTAARSGSFTQAAAKLGLTKSAVGKTIARLEARLGVKLFHRTTRMSRLTVDGEAYFAVCSAAMEDIVNAQTSLVSDNRELRGRVHIDMPVAFGRDVLLPILIEITKPHSEMRLSLTFSDATSDLLRDDVDLAIRFGALKDSSHLITRRLSTQSRILCGSPGYFSERGRPLSLEDINCHRCIIGTVEGPPTVWQFSDGEIDRRVIPQNAHQMTDGEAIVEAAVGGLGLIQMPSSILRAHLAAGRLETVLDEYAPAPVEVHAIWPKQVHLSHRVRYIIDCLVSEAAKGRLD